MNNSKEFKDGLTPEQSLDRLNEFSSTFCSAKWLQLTLNLHHGQTSSCCLANPSYFTVKDIIKDKNIFHNTPENYQNRKKLWNGEKASSCDFCWKQEDQGEQFSERVIKSASPWAFENIEKVKEAAFEKPIKPSYLEVSFSNKCNLKCAYCAPQTSSSIYKEIEKFGPYTDSSQYADLKALPADVYEEATNPMLDSFGAWFEEIAPELKVLRFTGGEPLLSDRVFHYLERLKTKAYPELDIEVNSNLSLPQTLVKKLADLMRTIPRHHYKEFKMITSIDTSFKDTGYVRSGFNSKLFKENIDYLLKTIPDMKLRFTITFSVFSLFEFKELLEYILERKKEYKEYDKILFSLYPLVSPTFLSLKPVHGYFQDQINQIDEYIHNHVISDKEPFGFNEYEISSFEKIKKFYKSSYSEKVNNLLKSDFYFFINDFDARKKSNMLETFPALNDFWEDCKACADTYLKELLDSKNMTIHKFHELILSYQRVHSFSKDQREKIRLEIYDFIENVEEELFWKVRAKVERIFDVKARSAILLKLIDRAFHSHNLQRTISLGSMPKLISSFSVEEKRYLKEKYTDQICETMLVKMRNDLESKWGWSEVLKSIELSKDEINILIEKNEKPNIDLTPLIAIYRWEDDLEWWKAQLISHETAAIHAISLFDNGIQARKLLDSIETLNEPKSMEFFVSSYLTSPLNSEIMLKYIEKHLQSSNKEIVDEMILKAMTTTKIDKAHMRPLIELLKNSNFSRKLNKC